MNVLAHRGIDLDRADVMNENSLVALRWSMAKGFGLELDLQITRDGKLIVAHDADMAKWSGGRGKQLWSARTIADIEKLEPGFGPLCRFSQAMDLLKEFPQNLVAVHIKAANQTKTFLQAICDGLKGYEFFHTRVLLFDLKPDAARFLRQMLPQVGLGASVAHNFDIQRFNARTGQTLLPTDALLKQTSPYNWAWLDEWDRLNVGEMRKSFYEDVVGAFVAKGLKVALISPELHAGELHQDSESLMTLEKRWKSLIALRPDAVCTDYPARFSALLGKTT